jgi:hypothetical protein
MLSFVLMGAFLALPGCERGPEMVDPGVIHDAVRQTLDSGSATVQGRFVIDEVKGRATEILAMKGEVDFEAASQSLEFSDSQAQPDEMAEVNHLISNGADYFVDNAEVASGYPAGTEWVKWTFDNPAPEEGFPDAQALMEPLIAINLLRGAQSIEEVEPEEESEDASRFRVIVDFEEAASDAPSGVSNRLALFDELTYEEGLEKGHAPIVVAIDDEGTIREVRTAIPSYASESDQLTAYQTYTVRFVDFGVPVSIENPSDAITADLNPDLYIGGLSPARLRSEELEISASTCESDLGVADSLKAMAAEWGIENPPEERARLIDAIASKYTERYSGGSLSGEPFRSHELVQVDTKGCTRGILRGLEGQE